MKIIYPALVVLCILSTFACSKPATVINGEAFVVTKGAGNYKLGLVEISVIPEKEMVQHLQNKNNDSLVQQAKVEFEKASASYQQSKDLYGRVSDRLDQKNEKFDADIKKDFESVDDVNRAYAKLQDIHWNVDEAKSTAAKLQADLMAMETARAKLNELSSRAAYFEGLPAAVTTTTTNADGKFSLSIPQNGRYALVARSTRKVADKDEAYYWAVWVNADGKEQTVLLSNNNTTDSSSATSAISASYY